MDDKILVSLITLISAIIAALVALVVTKWQLRAGERSLDVQIQMNYASNLLQERHKAYPALYALLSDFSKELRFGMVQQDYLKDLKDKLEEWDSAHAILVEAPTQKRLYDFRKKLILDLLERDKPIFQDKAFCNALRNEIGELETLLRSELGVYVVAMSSSRVRPTFQEIKKSRDQDTENDS